MSAAEHQPPSASNASSQGKDNSLNAPPQRPALRKPPARPERSPGGDVNLQPTIEEATAPISSGQIVELQKAPPKESESSQSASSGSTYHPIAPPSEPMQYRAIGLVKGVYRPSDEQLNRGDIIADDNTEINAVLLGRVTSLVKKHIDLEQSHLWVVYPRTRLLQEDAPVEEESHPLHLQIVGIWEPDTLGLPGENPNTLDTDGQDAAKEPEADDEAVATEAATLPAPAEAETASESEVPSLPSENYFSIRGEVVAHDEEKDIVTVKIVQGAKRPDKGPKAFKLHLYGKIEGKTLGYFWEFEAERNAESLVVTEGRCIRMVPPKKKKKGGRPGKPRRGHRSGPGDRSRPSRNSEKPRIRPSAPVKSNPL